jgi:hypothetical protein
MSAAGMTEPPNKGMKLTSARARPDALAAEREG